jgi:TRAP-type mannitol/chloroaromatic compound transport system substrate-binding protein
MQKRDFLKGAGLGTAIALASIRAGNALAQSGREVKWRLSSAYPKSLDTIFGATEVISRIVSGATGGRFQIQVFAGGEIVPGGQVIDAVQNGTIECGQTASSFAVGKNPAYAFSTALPFGPNARQQNAWMYHGGGLALVHAFMQMQGMISFPAGNTGGQMGGWFRKEIKSVDDLRGIKMRIAGLGGTVLAKLGVVPQLIPTGDIYPALEKGTIDAAEFLGPYDDEKLGFNKVAKYYYCPGFWEGCAGVDLVINLKAWQSLPKEYQVILEAAAAYANVDMLAKYDAYNMAALKRLVATGTQLRAFPTPLITAAYTAAHSMYDEIAAKNETFAKMYAAWIKFRDEQIQWFAVDENRYDSFMANAIMNAGRPKK